ncbi:hypothetical protein BKA65DRAFT_496680 [Rhexocercosporidium sp. MPI-PUGE-AT-0058]|nr:hypothetical protein BKA65DRAFT_496680 [Rhexocercosporidium sp. MPI-PUGE-AT-0058]
MPQPTHVTAEAISSEPVIIHNPTTQDPLPDLTPQEIIPTSTLDLPTRLSKLERHIASLNLTGPTIQSETIRHFRQRSRSRTPPPRRESTAHPLMKNSSSIEEFLRAQKPDALAEIQTGLDYYNRHLVHVTTHSTAAEELAKLDWVFRIGMVDSWVTKPPGGVFGVGSAFGIPGAPYADGIRNRRGGEFVVVDEGQRFDDTGAERTSVPLVRLGEVFRLLPSSSSASSDEEQIHISEEVAKQEKKVKFLTIIRGRSGVGYFKLLISYSREAALVDIFHEIVNAHSVLFVGAVLRDTVVPLAVQEVLSVNFRKVGGVEEAEALEEGIIGVIC